LIKESLGEVLEDKPVKTGVEGYDVWASLNKFNPEDDLKIKAKYERDT